MRGIADAQQPGRYQRSSRLTSVEQLDLLPVSHADPVGERRERAQCPARSRKSSALRPLDRPLQDDERALPVAAVDQNGLPARLERCRWS